MSATEGIIEVNGGSSGPPPQADGPERDFVRSVKSMLARADYLLPLAAAERQFRDHYYGLNSAALLEDLFFDALGHFLRETDPTHRLSRPPTGQKGWDYAFDGLEISHKVGQNVSEIAALWDVTKADQLTWSFEEPIVYVLGRNNPAGGVRLSVDDGPHIALRAVSELGKLPLSRGTSVAIVNWPANGIGARLLDVVEVDPGESVPSRLPFDRIWNRVAEHIRAGLPANELDVLAAGTPASAAALRAVRRDRGGTEVQLNVDFRGGVYFFARELLQDLPVSKNNRALLISTATVRELLATAKLSGFFAPMPIWYWLYAMDRPPDMYSAQRAEYDALFSARSGTVDS